MPAVRRRCASASSSQSPTLRQTCRRSTSCAAVSSVSMWNRDCWLVATMAGGGSAAAGAAACDRVGGGRCGMMREAVRRRRRQRRGEWRRRRRQLQGLAAGLGCDRGTMTCSSPWRRGAVRRCKRHAGASAAERSVLLRQTNWRSPGKLASDGEATNSRGSDPAGAHCPVAADWLAKVHHFAPKPSH